MKREKTNKKKRKTGKRVEQPAPIMGAIQAPNPKHQRIVALRLHMQRHRDKWRALTTGVRPERIAALLQTPHGDRTFRRLLIAKSAYTAICGQKPPTESEQYDVDTIIRLVGEKADAIDLADEINALRARVGTDVAALLEFEAGCIKDESKESQARRADLAGIARGMLAYRDAIADGLLSVAGQYCSETARRIRRYGIADTSMTLPTEARARYVDEIGARHILENVRSQATFIDAIRDDIRSLRREEQWGLQRLACDSGEEESDTGLVLKPDEIADKVDGAFGAPDGGGTRDPLAWSSLPSPGPRPNTSVPSRWDQHWRDRWGTESPYLLGRAKCIVAGHLTEKYGLEDRCTQCRLLLPMEGKRLGNCDCGKVAEYSVMIRSGVDVHADHVCRNCFHHLTNTPKMTFEVMTDVR
jgi:hypothetical protein